MPPRVTSGTWPGPKPTKTAALFAGLALIVAITASNRAHAAGYTVTDLGTLGGVRSSAAGLNESGEVVGESDTAEPEISRAFIYSGGTMKNLGTLGGPRSLSSGRGINFDGKAVGETDLFPDRHLRGFLYGGGTMMDIGSLGGTEPFPSGTRAQGINSAGKIVGSSHTVNNRRHAFLLQGGVMTDLGALPGTDSSEAYAINDAGQIVGISEVPAPLLRHHAFRYSGGVMTDLGTLPGGEESRAFGINAAGTIVGDAALSGITNRHAVLFSGGTVVDLGTLANGESFAKGINSAGVVVGLSDVATGGRHGFIYQGGTMIDLNTLVPVGVVIKNAAAINSAGQIAATGTVNGSTDHALLLTPTLLSRVAYAWANQPTAASYTPAPQYAYNSAGGPIQIARQSKGVYDVAFESLPGWGNNGLSSAASVTAYGSSTIACSLASYASSPNRVVATVSCFNVVTKVSADSRFTVLVVGNQSVPAPSTFVFSGGGAPIPPPNPAWSWTSGNDAIAVSHNPGAGDYNVLLGTGKSAELVTASGGARRCNNAGGTSGGLRVRCYDLNGAPSDERFWVVKVAGGLPDRRLGFAVANQPAAASYTPAASTAFNSSGDAIIATRSSVGRYAIAFAGLQKPAGHTEHVQVTSIGTTLSTCNVVNWGNSDNRLRVLVECRNGAGQFVDSQYGVLVIE
jgi:probable HAF family extracellular repeat protein